MGSKKYRQIASGSEAQQGVETTGRNDEVIQVMNSLNNEIFMQRNINNQQFIFVH